MEYSVLVATFVAACSTQLHDALFFGNKVTGGGGGDEPACGHFRFLVIADSGTRVYPSTNIPLQAHARSRARGHGTGDEVVQQGEVRALEECASHPVRRVSHPVVVGADQHLKP